MINKIIDTVEAALADVPDGAIVNLGIALPTLVANHLPADREAILHSENGVMGMGPGGDRSDCGWSDGGRNRRGAFLYGLAGNDTCNSCPGMLERSLKLSRQPWGSENFSYME